MNSSEPSHNEVICGSRLANALFSDAKMSKSAGALLDNLIAAADLQGGSSTLNGVLFTYSKAYGGLWVGGKAVLTDQSLRFEPNALNRMVHEDGETLQLVIPLSEITSVNVRFGVLTKIIDVQVSDQKFSLRCFGAEKFASEINFARHSSDRKML